MNMLTKALSKVFIEEYEEEQEEYTHRELGKIIEIPIGEIQPNPNQPRRHFDMGELTSLAKSISQDGIVQPLSVRRTDSGFELVSGERRLRASKIAGLSSVPCIIINIDEERSAVIALIENIQRCSLNCFEEAAAIERLIKVYKLTQEETAVRLGMAQSTVANKLRLLKLSEYERKIILDNGLTERHGRALLKISDEEQRKMVLLKAAEGNWTVSQLEKYIQNKENEQIKKNNYEKRAVMLKDVRLFFNTVNKAVDVMRLAGVKADTKRIDHDDFIEYIIKIPNEKKH